MNKLAPLVKYGIINSLGINRFIKKKGHESKAPILVLTLLGVGLFALATVYMFIYGGMFNLGGAPGGILLLAITLGSMIVAINSITNANSYLFNPKDYDMLMSMPIKTRTIFLSKAIDLVILNYATLLFFYFPSVIAYCFFNEFNLYFLITVIIGFFFIPLLPMSVFGFISYLFGFLKLTPKVKKLIRTLMYIFLTVGIMVVTFSITNGADEEAFFLSIYERLQKIYYPGNLAYLGVRGDVLKYLLFILISVLSFVIFMAFASITYLKGNSQKEVVKDHSEKVEFKTSSKVKALFVKELKGYFSVPLYIGNTIIGPILSTLGTVFILLRAKAEYVNLGDDKIVEMATLMPLLLILISCFACSLSPTTPSSVSLEGKSMWILKSSPIEYRDIKNSKLFVSYVVAIPFLVINTIIALVWKRFIWYDYLFILAIPTLTAIVSSKIGLLTNLMKVRLDFDNPAKVIKQSLPVLLTMLFSFLIVMHAIGVGMVLFVITKETLFGYLGFLLVLGIAYVIVTVLLNKAGKKLYNNIVC